MDTKTKEAEAHLATDKDPLQIALYQSQEKHQGKKKVGFNTYSIAEILPLTEKVITEQALRKWDGETLE